MMNQDDRDMVPEQDPEVSLRFDELTQAAQATVTGWAAGHERGAPRNWDRFMVSQETGEPHSIEELVDDDPDTPEDESESDSYDGTEDGEQNEESNEGIVTDYSQDETAAAAAAKKKPRSKTFLPKSKGRKR